MAFARKPTPTWQADPRTGMVALAGNKVIMPGTYSSPYSNVRSAGGGGTTTVVRPTGGVPYKIYQSKGPGHRLFRSYDPGVLGKSDIGKANDYWEWSPASDKALWQGARQTALKQGGGATTTGAQGAGTAIKSGGTMQPADGSAVASALGGAGGTSAGGLASNPFLTDPGYLSALAAEQAGSQQADNALRAAQEQAIVQFGDPSLAQAAGLNLNPLTATAAQANTAAGTSTVAGLQRTRDDNQTNILDSLAAQGALDSGQTGYATGRNQQAYGQDLYNATQTALSGLNTAAASDVSTKQGLHSDVTNALTTAYNTMVANPALWGAANVGGQTGAANAAATGAGPPISGSLGGGSFVYPASSTPIAAAGADPYYKPPSPTGLLAPVAAALQTPNNRATLGPKAPAPPRLATANAYAAGTARGGRAG